MDTAETLVGRQIGNYHVVAGLGVGAMGEVYLAEHPHIGKRVAIKVLIQQLSGHPEMAQRFMAEARTVNTIRHPNIIEIYDFGTLPDGRLYYTMEYLDGRELSQVLEERGPLPLDEAARIAEQLGSALDAAHAAGVVHRDLKPDNIILCERPGGARVKVLDFGIAKLMASGPQSKSLTSTGMILGTPLYMSPEQAAGRVSEVSVASDVYAFGVILFQMVTGRVPFNAPTAAQLLTKHITELPPRLGEIMPGVPRELEQVVGSCLEKEPGARPPSVGAVVQTFQRISEVGRAETQIGAADSLPSGAAVDRTTGDRSTLAASAAQAAGTGAWTGEAPAETGAHRLRGILAGLGALALIGAGITALLWPPEGESALPTETRATSFADRSPSDDAPVPRKTTPRAAPVSPPMAEPPPRPVAESTMIAVKAGSRKTRVEVRLPDGAPETREPPFQLRVKPGTQVTLRAYRTGYREETRTFEARRKTEVAFALKRRRRRRSRKAKRRTRRVERAATKKGSARVDRRVPTRRRVGAGTLSPYGN